MQGAPSVTYPVGRSLLTALLPLAAWTAGACAAAAFLASAAPFAARAAAAAAILAAGVPAALAWRNSPRGSLHWDGQAWRLEAGPAAAGSLAVGLDAQRLMLLRVGEGAGARWVWAEARRQPRAWESLRRAVYSRASNLPAQGESPPRPAA